MGVDMDLNFVKRCTVRHSPKTVLRSHRHSLSTEKRKEKAKHARKDDLLILNEDFLEIDFGRYRCASCKTISSGPVEPEGNVEFRRGSVYRSSREIRRMTNIGTSERRRKIEVSQGSDTTSSVSIVDSLCPSDEESPWKRSSVISLNLDSNPTSNNKHNMQPPTTNRLKDICLNVDDRKMQSAEALDRDSTGDLKFRCGENIGRSNDSNGLQERDKVCPLPKSLSAKVEMPPSPSVSESCPSSKTSSNFRLNSVRKMFDPLIKSKSLRSPLAYAREDGLVKTTGTVHVRRDSTFRRSTTMSHDFSSTSHNCRLSAQVPKTDCSHSTVQESPVHLHGFLKCRDKHGVPFFEFSLKCREEVLVAQTRKSNNSFSWVYTFHSHDGRKKSSAEGWALNEGKKESSMVGQMQACCYLCSELEGTGSFDNSLVTEFVLYDIAHARRSTARESQDQASSLPEVKCGSRNNPRCVRRTSKIDDIANAVKIQHQTKHTRDSRDPVSLNLYPWAPSEPRPDLEIAAVVIQVPYEKTESLRYKRGNKIDDNAHPSLLNFSVFEQMKEQLPERTCNTVQVVIPTGNHGLPNCDSRGPSSLLERWRSGGGCDCGGWDMACPLTVFGNPKIQFTEDQSLVDNQKPLELFLQGAKEITPALTVKFVEEGNYAVDFHAHLSSLQAFFISVAMLHGSGVVSSSRQEIKEVPLSNSLKTLFEEEVQILIEAVSEEKKAPEKMKDMPSSYALNPPFSPIARV
ncbi:uncharacterized protein LOC115690303 [Syzygium oleosum]|uniref:uncharacterized protein LOC115690303 n=1 Tax=Syzygium oleosum TaxID=219896 RepID=UPI0024BB2CE5|nr:uncharacterized protein LOC115690303 [Syzygium oleosum]XP_030472484.2 uncharacterized protein LOC115690303 [Syzygium oleosum]XP_030472485.2 uncharacterized protein LOC115690303 [Syzygium oleosum]